MSTLPPNNWLEKWMQKFKGKQVQTNSKQQIQQAMDTKTFVIQLIKWGIIGWAIYYMGSAVIPILELIGSWGEI